ncbi:MAG: transglycosylase domain-containing protein [Lachnospiraceae bacterium]|nr:transglycosylase domain-containing protein [Lachnospiraceae bacterium]
MNYGKRGVVKQKRTLKALTPKFGNFFAISVFKVLLIAVIVAGVGGVCAAVGAFMGVIATAPDVSNVSVAPAGFSTTVYDSEGHQLTKLIAENSNRVYVTLDKIPEHTQNAFIAIEDDRFRSHNGIDIQGIFRAGVVALTSGDLSQGASTITQQLLKNNVFTSWTSESSLIEKFKRKFQEQYCAVQLEKYMDKDTILENYLNTINLGQGTLGVQAASNRYFGKPVSSLTISESAVIAAITQNPSRWNPISHPDNNAKRRETVLTKMRDQGFISEVEFETAMADDVYDRIKKVDETTEKTTIYSYFVDELTEQVITDLQEVKGYSYTQAYNALYSGGLSIFTTQDPAIQKICDEEFANEANFPASTKLYLTVQLTYLDENGDPVNFNNRVYEKKASDMIFTSEEAAMERLEEYKAIYEDQGYTYVAETVSLTPQPQASVSVIEQSTGKVVALVGGRGDKVASLTLNRATKTMRQPGSCFKVLAAYAPALDSAGKTLASTQVDEPYNYSNGRPVSNWYSGYKGVCTYRYGIEQSLNIVAVKTLTDITPQLGFDYLLNFGFSTLVKKRTESNGMVTSDITQALALGGVTDGVTNIELANAYATIANGGTYTKPIYYTKILDHDGNILIENTAKTRRVIKETTAYLLTSAMVDVVTKGTGARVNFGNMAIAGKTGTTSSNVDVWFSGFTPYYTASTWAGYDNNIHMTGDETNTAKYLWKAIMGRIHEELPYKDFDKPEGIVSATVCSQSGYLYNGTCGGGGHTEIFDKDNMPTTYCNGTQHPHGSGVVQDVNAIGTVGFVCAATGLRAATGCPYAVAGIIISNDYCEHGIAPTAEGGAADGTTPVTIDPNAAADAAAVAAAAQAAAQAAAAQAAAEAAAAAQAQAAAEAAAAAQAAQAAALQQMLMGQ